MKKHLICLIIFLSFSTTLKAEPDYTLGSWEIETIQGEITRLDAMIRNIRKMQCDDQFDVNIANRLVRERNALNARLPYDDQRQEELLFEAPPLTDEDARSILRNQDQFRIVLPQH